MSEKRLFCHKNRMQSIQRKHKTDAKANQTIVFRQKWEPFLTWIHLKIQAITAILNRIVCSGKHSKNIWERMHRNIWDKALENRVNLSARPIGRDLQQAIDNQRKNEKNMTSDQRSQHKSQRFLGNAKTNKYVDDCCNGRQICVYQ